MIFTVAEFQKKELLEAEKIYKFPKKKIFTTGYFYFEHMLKNIKPNNTNPKNILFAPTWIRSKKNLFEDYSVSIIQLLLDYGYSVTLRTHPETFKRSKKTLKLIFQKFGDKKNFQLNTNLDNIDCFEKSKLLITDDGGVGMEYAYLYKKPIIYINYVKKIHNQFYKDLNIEPIEDKFKRECVYAEFQLLSLYPLPVRVPATTKFPLSVILTSPPNVLIPSTSNSVVGDTTPTPTRPFPKEIS